MRWSVTFLFPVSCEPCEDEWIFVARVHSCYMAPHHPLTWLDAEEYCQQSGAHLVSVNSIKESDYIRMLADQHNPQFLTWIGLSRDDNTTESPFRWSDGSDLSYTSFREGESMKA
ncbi:lectin C-type domain protein [Cooperia oncophora]